MKVEDKVTYTKKFDEPKEYLKKILPKGYVVKEDTHDYVRVLKKWFPIEASYVNFGRKKICVRNQEIYKVLEEFGEKYKFEEIIKEWVE